MNKLTIKHVGYVHHDHGEPEPYEEDYGDGHERTYHVHDSSGQHIATVVHYETDEGWPSSIKYIHHVNGKVAYTNYGAPRDINIKGYGRDGHVNYDASQKTRSRQKVTNAVNAFHASPTGQKWLSRRYKLKAEESAELLSKVRRILSIGESTDEHRSLGYETARRLHGGMGGMNFADTMAAVKKVRLRTKNPAELEAFHAGAKDYCQKNCHKESVNESTTTYDKLAADHRAKAEEYRKTPVSRFVAQFGDKAGRVRERFVAYHSERAHHYETLAAKQTESYVAESDIDFAREYLYRSERAIHNHRMGRHLIAAAHQKAAEEHAESYFKKTGKKIVDPLYTGSSKYISQLSSEATTPKVKNARIQAWHWMGAKKAMGAKYGFDHNVPVNQIPTSMEHNGKTVNPRRAVIWVAQQFANRDKAKKNMREETGSARFQVLAGGQDSGSAGTVHDTMDDAWLAAKKLKKHPQYKGSSITIHDRDTGALHSLSGRIIGRLPVRK